MPPNIAMVWKKYTLYQKHGQNWEEQGRNLQPLSLPLTSILQPNPTWGQARSLGGTVSYYAEERKQVVNLRWRKNWKVASTMVKGITPHSSTHLEIFILELSGEKT